MTKKDFEETVLKSLDSLKNDVGGLKADVGGLQNDVGGLKADVGGLQNDVGGLKADLRRLEVLHEETSEKIDQIIEVVSPEMKKNNVQDKQLNDHESRISKLELAA